MFQILFKKNRLLIIFDFENQLPHYFISFLHIYHFSVWKKYFYTFKCQGLVSKLYEDAIAVFKNWSFAFRSQITQNDLAISASFYSSSLPSTSSKLFVSNTSWSKHTFKNIYFKKMKYYYIIFVYNRCFI